MQREKKVLVAADIHLGLEYELWLGGISIPSQTEHILARLNRHILEIEPDRLLLLGDVKHNVPRSSWQEKREVPAFLGALSKNVPVDIVTGNHDGGLADMAPPGTRIHSSSGFILDGIGYFHGHTWPDQRLLNAELLVTAHLHPAVRLKDPLGHLITRRAWVRTALSSSTLKRQYGENPPAPDLIIVPAFNDLCGGLPLNELREDERGPVMALADLDDAKISLLDGTDLGSLRSIRSAQKRA